MTVREARLHANDERDQNLKYLDERTDNAYGSCRGVRLDENLNQLSDDHLAIQIRQSHKRSCILSEVPQNVVVIIVHEVSVCGKTGQHVVVILFQAFVETRREGSLPDLQELVVKIKSHVAA